MIYINNNINWCSTIQLYFQIFEINTCNCNKQSVYFTENELNMNDTDSITINPQLYSSMYRGGGGNKHITDIIQYLPPEYLDNFDPKIKPTQNKNKCKQINMNNIPSVISVSVHSTPATPVTHAKFADHKTEPTLFQLQTEYGNIDPKQSVTFGEGILYSDGGDGGAMLSDNSPINNEIKYDNEQLENMQDMHDMDNQDSDSDGYAAGGETPNFSDVVSLPLTHNFNTKTKTNTKMKTKKHKKRVRPRPRPRNHELKSRIDISYLPDLWNLSSNIFSIGVMLFILLNGYAPFEKATVNDRWYKEIYKNKFRKFWKLHRASPINAIQITSAPISYNAKKNQNQNHNRNGKIKMQQINVNKNKVLSISANNIFSSLSTPNTPNTPNTEMEYSPTSPNTAIPALNSVIIHDNNNIFSDDEIIPRKQKTIQRNNTHTHTHFRKQQTIALTLQTQMKINKSISTGNIYAESEVENNKKHAHSHKKKKNNKTPKVEYDFRSVHGLINDLLRYDSCIRLHAFFNYNQNDIDFENNLQPLYHKYWFIDIGCNDNQQYMEHKYEFNEENKENNDVKMDANEILFLNILNTLRHDKQEENRKKAKNIIEDEYILKCICWVMDEQESEPLYYPYENIIIEGLSLNGYGELYTTTKWSNVFHQMYHTIQNNCHGNVKKEYTQDHKRLICEIKIANNNNNNNQEEKSQHKLVEFEILIWRSVKWKDLSTNEDILYIVQWKRLHGNTLDCTRVINHVMHQHCPQLFYLPKNIRSAMRN